MNMHRGERRSLVRSFVEIPPGFREKLEDIVERALTLLDALDGDTDAEPCCEDEGAQCDDEGWQESDCSEERSEGAVHAWDPQGGTEMARDLLDAHAGRNPSLDARYRTRFHLRQWRER